MNDYKQELATLEIGLAGCHGETIDGASITYYDRRLRPYFGCLVNGGFVIDKSKPLDENYTLCVQSPLCKGAMPPGGISKFQGARGSIVATALASQPSNGYCGLARLMLTSPECGAFDDVAPDVFANWWRVRGARVGQRNGEWILWEDGKEERIPAFEQRYVA